MTEDKATALFVVFSCPFTGLMTLCVGGEAPKEIEDVLRLGPFRSLSFDSGGSLYGVPMGRRTGSQSMIAIADSMANLGGWSVERRHLQNDPPTNVYRLMQIETGMVPSP